MFQQLNEAIGLLTESNTALKDENRRLRLMGCP